MVPQQFYGGYCIVDSIDRQNSGRRSHGLVPAAAAARRDDAGSSSPPQRDACLVAGAFFLLPSPYACMLCCRYPSPSPRARPLRAAAAPAAHQQLV